MAWATGREAEVVQDHLSSPGDDHQLVVQVQLPTLSDLPRPDSSTFSGGCTVSYSDNLRHGMVWQGMCGVLLLTCWYSGWSSWLLMINLHSIFLFLAALGVRKLSISWQAGLEASNSESILCCLCEGLWWECEWWGWLFSLISGQSGCELFITCRMNLCGYSVGSEHQLAPFGHGLEYCKD
jgi:hypothetical protein